LIWTVFIVLVPQSADCSSVSPSSKPKLPNQALFIATDAVSFGKKPAFDDPMPILKGFAIARVQEHFCGLPWWCQKFVLLWRPAQWKGEPYFYDGGRPYGLLTHFLPIVCFDYCGRSNLVGEAEIDLRVLKDGPSQTSGRIVGHVRRPMEGPWQGMSGIKVTIKRPTGDIVTTTDKKGLYDVPALPPGDYALHFDPPLKSFSGCSSPFKLAAGDVTQCDAEVK
jgi:hypothetical protein